MWPGSPTFRKPTNWHVNVFHNVSSHRIKQANFRAKFGRWSTTGGGGVSSSVLDLPGVEGLRGQRGKETETWPPSLPPYFDTRLGSVLWLTQGLPKLRYCNSIDTATTNKTAMISLCEPLCQSAQRKRESQWRQANFIPFKWILQSTQSYIQEAQRLLFRLKWWQRTGNVPTLKFYSIILQLLHVIQAHIITSWDSLGWLQFTWQISFKRSSYVGWTIWEEGQEVRISNKAVFTSTPALSWKDLGKPLETWVRTWVRTF